MNHMAVGKNESVGSKDETRAAAPGLAPLVSFALAKLAHLNVSHGGASRLGSSDYRVGIGIKQRAIVCDSAAGWGRDTRKCRTGYTSREVVQGGLTCRLSRQHTFDDSEPHSVAERPKSCDGPLYGEGTTSDRLLGFSQRPHGLQSPHNARRPFVAAPCGA